MLSKLLSSIPNSIPGSKQPSKEQAGGLMAQWNQHAAILVAERPWAFVNNNRKVRESSSHPGRNNKSTLLMASSPLEHPGIRTI